MAVRLAILEAVLLFGAASGAMVVWTPSPGMDWSSLMRVFGRAFALSFVCIVAFYYNELYEIRIVRSLPEFSWRLVQAFGIAFVLLAAIYSVFPQANIENGPFLSGLLIVFASLVALRALCYLAMRGRVFGEPVLILGTGLLARKLVEEIEARPDAPYTVVGIAADGSVPGENAPSGPLLGPLAHLPKIVEEVRPRRIIVALAERRSRLPVRELLEARVSGVLVDDGLDFYERLTGKVAIESLNPSNLIFSKEFRKSKLDLAVGRFVSLLAAAVGLVGLAPVMGVLVLLVRLESPGPVFFVQERVGLYGRRFKLIKFRTMHPVPGPKSEWARDNADRITRIGKWLRKFRLDELPQFVNILRGDMNLVGPRPHPVSNFELFMESIPYYFLRTTVRPGVTGWAQVRLGYANGLDEETEKMRYDLYYIRHLSLWFDLRILVETVRIVLFGRIGGAVDQHRTTTGQQRTEVAVSVNGR